MEEIKKQQPNKVPVIIERYEGERSLPLMERCKFLVPDHITVAELMHIVRRRLVFTIFNILIYSNFICLYANVILGR